MAVQVLRGANLSAQWYWDNFPGGTVFSHLEKSLKHTTETKGWPGYSGGASAPNATYHPVLRQIRQHFPCNVSARALRDPAGTAVRENRDRVFQLEIVCYSDKALARSVGGLWVGDLTDSHFTDLAWIDVQLNQDLGLPLQTSVKWREGQGTYVSGVRLSGPSYDAYRGILGHVHASGNTHWDPGGFRASKLMAKIAQLTKPAPPPPPPPPTPTGVADMILVRQDMGAAVDRIWLLTGTHKRYVATVSAYHTLREHIPYQADPPVSSQLLQSFESGDPITDVAPEPEPTPIP
jgi:hypothetical protein